MENAALAVVREMKEYMVFAIVCAPGSNGGDGLAIARHLCIMGKDVRVYIVGDPKKGSDDFKTNLKIMSKLAPEVLNTVNDENFDEFESALKGCETCIDAIFGTGLNRPVEGIYKRIIEAINSLASHVVAVDIEFAAEAFCFLVERGKSNYAATFTIYSRIPFCSRSHIGNEFGKMSVCRRESVFSKFLCIESYYYCLSVCRGSVDLDFVFAYYCGRVGGSPVGTVYQSVHRYEVAFARTRTTARI